MQKIIAIPARLASTRFPDKVLANIAGKPMIQWTYEQAVLAHPDRIVIVTDSKKVASLAEGFGAEVFLGRPDHLSGTSRIAEAAKTLQIDDASLVLNLQADEPLMAAENIQQVFENIARYPEASVATLCEKISDETDILKPSCVKVVRDARGYALYFSRSVIPFSPVLSAVRYFRHIGLYCFRAGFLKTLDSKAPSSLEKAESLEQLSFLYDGHKIHVDEARVETVSGVDFPSDVERVEAYLRRRR